jgi:RNA ligase (TIGR02306 family)
MSSTLIVDVCKIDKIEPHPNADRMEIAFIKGWTTCIVKDSMKEGDEVIFFPPDSMLPIELSDKLNVTKYLSKGRVKVAKLRGYSSYGFVTLARNVLGKGSYKIGDNVVDTLGVTKYEPPEVLTEGNAEKDHPTFHRYTDIENIRNFPLAFEEGEEVVMTEKVHGTNVRLGFIYDEGEHTWMAGSHNVRRKQYIPPPDKLKDHVEWTNYKLSRYWKPYDLVPGLGEMMSDLTGRAKFDVIVFGELYGQGIQDLQYGLKNLAFRVFDISINGVYISHDEMITHCNEFDVPTVPVVYHGPFSWDQLELATEGQTTLVTSPNEGHVREGVVIKPIVENPCDIYGNRKIYKNISFEYLNRKGGTENH